MTITRVEPSHPALTCTWAAGQDGSTTLRIRADRAKMEGEVVEISLRVLLGPEHVAVTIPVHVTK